MRDGNKLRTFLKPSIPNQLSNHNSVLIILLPVNHTVVIAGPTVVATIGVVIATTRRMAIKMQQLLLTAWVVAIKIVSQLLKMAENWREQERIG